MLTVWSVRLSDLASMALRPDKVVDLGCYFGRINSISTSELIAILSGFIYSKSLYKIKPKLYSHLAYMIPQSTPVKQYD